MTTTLVSATIFDLSEVLCKVKSSTAFAFQSLFLFSLAFEKNPQKFRSWKAGGRGGEARSLFRPVFPSSLKEFGPFLPTL